MNSRDDLRVGGYRSHLEQPPRWLGHCLLSSYTVYIVGPENQLYETVFVKRGNTCLGAFEVR